jgi:hypothetical protein
MNIFGHGKGHQSHCCSQSRCGLVSSLRHPSSSLIPKSSLPPSLIHTSPKLKFLSPSSSLLLYTSFGLWPNSLHHCWLVPSGGVNKFLHQNNSYQKGQSPLLHADRPLF